MRRLQSLNCEKETFVLLCGFNRRGITVPLSRVLPVGVRDRPKNRWGLGTASEVRFHHAFNHRRVRRMEKLFLRRSDSIRLITDHSPAVTCIRSSQQSTATPSGVPRAFALPWFSGARDAVRGPPVGETGSALAI
jgi:hypothetical protein